MSRNQPSQLDGRVTQPSRDKRIASPNVTTTRKKIAVRLTVSLHNHYKPFEMNVNWYESKRHRAAIRTRIAARAEDTCLGVTQDDLSPAKDGAVKAAY